MIGVQKQAALREIRAVRLMLESLAPTIAGCRFVHRSDNQAAVSIIHAGSRHAHLQVVALEIFCLCYRHCISLQAEWIPREENKCADILSKWVDADDWQFSTAFFQFLDAR